MRNRRTAESGRGRPRAGKVWTGSGVLLALFVPAACDSTGPDDLAYRVALYRCEQGCAVQTRVDSASRGDTMALHVTLDGTSPGDSVAVTIRGYCAENAVAYLSGVAARTFPQGVTCPDSVDRVYVSDSSRVDRYFLWFLNASVPRGRYRIEGRMLISPGGSAITRFTVN
ncbi:MAG: hypothetical protein ACREMV_15065 [Gemmatimonadales bacterium]